MTTRLKRWTRRVGVAVLVLIVAVTLAATGFDLASTGDQRAATALYRGPFVRVDGTLVAYRRWGTVGAPIVLLGGAAEPSWVWHEVGPRLARAGHRVYAIDLPPFGYTQRRGPYTMAGWLGLIRGAERRLAIRRPLVVGHSLGAGVAAALALAYPREVPGVVLLDGDALPFGSGRGWISNLFVFPYYPALFQLATGSDWLVGRVLRNAWGPDPPHFTDAILDQFEQPFRVAGTADALKQLVHHGIPGVTAAALRRLRVKRAVIWGASDTVDPRTSGEATAHALHVHLQIVPMAGHLSMLTNPQAVADAIIALAQP